MEQSVGKTLHEARMRRRVELAEVEARIRIRTRFLRALEEGEWEALPGEAYTRGFIRAYAGYLGLDGEQLAERHRREVGAERPGEALLGSDPARVRPERPRRLRRPPRAAALLAAGALVAALVVIGLSGGGDREAPRGRRDASPAPAQPVGSPPPSRPRAAPGLSLRLTARAEVWVCLLDGEGRRLIRGEILAPGAEAGPFRSGSFTVSLGNGEVSMTVNGRQASIPATPSPIAYVVGPGGATRELPAGERPTCT